jgi:hypothetical protein
MKREDDEQMWDLLGQSAQPNVSPFFARDVLRKLREEPRGLAWGFVLRRLVPASGLVLAAVVTVMWMHNLAGPKPEAANANEPDLIAQINPQDYEVVADLDELLTTDDNNLWDDNSSL